MLANTRAHCTHANNNMLSLEIRSIDKYTEVICGKARIIIIINVRFSNASLVTVYTIYGFLLEDCIPAIYYSARHHTKHTYTYLTSL